MQTPQKAQNSPTGAPDYIAMAPMEGIIDHTLRKIMTAIGGIDRCATEFVRVSNLVLPERIFKKYCPELNNDCRTPSGTNVALQILGDKPELMAANAAKACKLGASIIDINFGCPAKTVNNSGGGSVLLQNPETLFSITEAVNKAIPTDCLLTVKVRLGYQDKILALENAQALEAAGAKEIAIHARTKVEGYKPPAYWELIKPITESLKIPVIANGEIWTLHDLATCMDRSGTSNIMLGRGLIACPDLALLARDPDQQSITWSEACLLLLHYMQELKTCCPEKYINNLIKQWLIYLRVQYAGAHLFFERVKRIRAASEMEAAITHELNRITQKNPANAQIGNLNLAYLTDYLGKNNSIKKA